ncbi:MAG: GNAT family N-acetyltransferase [Chloroflexi bacterium]|nr:GNAT family N-acetyltransferase [Chloroflexota bacterium]
MEIVRQLSEHLWQQFVDQHPQGNLFHTPEMFQVFRRAEGHRPDFWAAIEGGRTLALLLPVQVTLKGGLLRYLTTRAVTYGSVLYDPSPLGREALATLLRTYVRKVSRGVLFTEFRNLSDLSTVQPTLNECSFAYEDHLNYLIDVARPSDEILQSFSKRTRKQIRRGLRRGEVTIEEITTREQVSLCYDLLCQTYAAAQVPLADRSLFESAFDVLHPKGMIRFVLARVGDSYVGSSIELLYKDNVYGWYGSVDREYSRYNPGELLMWHILQWSAQNGYRVYDFGGAGKPDEEYGVRDFKAKFGGELVCYGRNIYTHTQMRLKLSKLGYTIYRSLFT